MKILIGIMLPFIGTVFGALLVYLINKNINKKINVFLLSLSAGIMLSSAIFSLLIPSFELGASPFFIIISFCLGIILLYLCDLSMSKTIDNNMVFLAIMLHNIPEGLAVGVAFAGFINHLGVSLASAFALSIGITIQNIPEGAVVSIPMHLAGCSKNKSFFKGFISGIIEPLASLLAIFTLSFITSLLPFVLAFASGAMFYVTIDKLIPEYKKDDMNNTSIVYFTLGFILMMFLEQYL